MTDRRQHPGFAPRPRLSDHETERRMLETAVEMVNRTGLTVSLEHLSFEDLIRDADVSRTTAYRRWPYKYLFFADLLKELATASTPAEITSEAAVFPELRQIVRDHSEWLETPERRQDLMLELMRLGAVHDFDTMRASAEWRTYLALHATFLSVDDEELRNDLQAALAESERDFISRVAAGWQRIVEAFGYRLRPELGASFEVFATIASADLRGQVILALADPEATSRTVRAQPLGASEPADWSLPGLAIAGLAMAFFEPDPGIAWDAGRIAAVRRTFEAAPV